MISIGPFSIQVVIVAVAAMAAWLVARFLARRTPDARAKIAGGMLFHAQGRMVHAHMGELTMPSLKSTINSHFR